MSSEAGSQVSVSTDSEHILVMISGHNQTMVGGRVNSRSDGRHTKLGRRPLLLSLPGRL